MWAIPQQESATWQKVHSHTSVLVFGGLYSSTSTRPVQWTNNYPERTLRLFAILVNYTMSLTDMRIRFTWHESKRAYNQLHTRCRQSHTRRHSYVRTCLAMTAERIAFGQFSTPRSHFFNQCSISPVTGFIWHQSYDCHTASCVTHDTGLQWQVHAC